MATGNASIRRENLVDDAIGADEIAASVLAFTHLSSGIISSQAQAEGGVNTNTLLTPERAKQAIDALAPATVNATESVSGRGQLATLAQMASHTALGSSGASLLVQNKNVSKTPDRYTPAYMTGGTAAESNTAIWDSVTDGEFTITIDGTARDVTGLNFSTITSMAEVATVIQVGIRALTSSTETVAWSTNHFVITSVSDVSTSEVSVTSAVSGGTGTDISGVGTVYMDSESGQGTATAAVVDITLDAGMVPLLLDTGLLHADRIPIVTDLTATATEINQALDGVSVNVTDTNLNTLTAGAASDADTLHTHSGCFSATSSGIGSRNAVDTGSQVITHGLGTTPRQIIFFAQSGDANGMYSSGVANDTVNDMRCTYNSLAGVGETWDNTCIVISDGTDYMRGKVEDWNSTTFSIGWTKGNAGETVRFTWICNG